MIGYGVEAWCLDSLTTGRLVRGPRLVAQALYRRLITPRGTLRGGEEEAAYGLDIAAYVGAVGYPSAVGALPGLVRGELLKDDRVADVSVTPAIYAPAEGQLAIELEINVVLAEDDETFSLTLAVSETSVALIGGTA